MDSDDFFGFSKIFGNLGKLRKKTDEFREFLFCNFSDRGMTLYRFWWVGGRQFILPTNQLLLKSRDRLEARKGALQKLKSTKRRGLGARVERVTG